MNNKINPYWNHAKTMHVCFLLSTVSMTKMTSNLLHSIPTHLIILVLTVFKWHIDEDSFIIS